MIRALTEIVELTGDVHGKVLYQATQEFDFAANTLVVTGANVFSGTIAGSDPVILRSDESRFEVNLATGEERVRSPHSQQRCPGQGLLVRVRPRGSRHRPDPRGEPDVRLQRHVHAQRPVTSARTDGTPLRFLARAAEQGRATPSLARRWSPLRQYWQHRLAPFAGTFLPWTLNRQAPTRSLEAARARSSENVPVLRTRETPTLASGQTTKRPICRAYSKPSSGLEP